MTRRLLALLATLFVTASMLAACTDDGEPAFGPTTTAVPATTAPAQPGTAECSNDTPIPAIASYRPDRPLGPPGTRFPEGSTMRAIQDRERLVVGVSADTLLFGARNPLTDRLEGFDIDVLREIAFQLFGGRSSAPEDIDDRIEFRVINYAQRLPVLEDNSVDLVAHTMTINCTRWQRIAFSTVYYDAEQKVLVTKGSPIQYVEELDGERVCAAEGSTNIENIAPYPVEVVGVPDLTDCLVLFQQSAVDAITGDDTVLAGFVDQDPYARVIGKKSGQLSQEPYGVGANAEHVDLVQFVNSVLDQLRANGRLAQLDRTHLSALPAEAPPAPNYDRPLP